MYLCPFICANAIVNAQMRSPPGQEDLDVQGDVTVSIMWMKEVNRERQSLSGMKGGAEGIDRDGGARSVGVT